MASVYHICAPWGEGAAGNILGKVRGHSGNGEKLGALGLQRRNRLLQGLGVGMFWILIDSFGHRGLHDSSRIHDLDPVAEPGHHSEVMGDENHGRTELVLQAFDQFQDLGLDGHVEGGRRFVRDEQFGLGDQGHRDHDALAHASGKLVGIEVNSLGRVLDAHFVQGVDGQSERSCITFSVKPCWPIITTGFSFKRCVSARKARICWLDNGMLSVSGVAETALIFCSEKQMLKQKSLRVKQARIVS